MNIIYSKLIEIISLNQGIVWRDSTILDTLFRLQFCVHDSKTRMLVNFVSEVSNISLYTYARMHPGELEPDADPDDELVYEYRSKPGGDVTDQACWLGAHLAWAMFKMGLITADQERDFCRAFGAVSRSV